LPKTETGFYLDLSDFDVEFNKIVRDQIPSYGMQALRQMGAEIIKDAIQEEPRAPHKTGHLWRSGKVLDPETKRDELFIIVGFDTAYAAIVHEMPDTTNWTLKGSGSKYLEAKVIRNAKRYYEYIAGYIKARAK